MMAPDRPWIGIVAAFSDLGLPALHPPQRNQGLRKRHAFQGAKTDGSGRQRPQPKPGRGQQLLELLPGAFPAARGKNEHAHVHELGKVWPRLLRDDVSGDEQPRAGAIAWRQFRKMRMQSPSDQSCRMNFRT
jgi:hypothetical protein